MSTDFPDFFFLFLHTAHISSTWTDGESDLSCFILFHHNPTSRLEQSKALKKSTNCTSWADLANSRSLKSEGTWNPPTASNYPHLMFQTHTGGKKQCLICSSSGQIILITPLKPTQRNLKGNVHLQHVHTTNVNTFIPTLQSSWQEGRTLASVA